MPSTDFHIQWAMYFDTLSSTMLLVVTGVGSLIHIYAIGYMHGDKDFHRFFTYLNLFLVLYVDLGHREQLPDALCGLGRGWTLLILTDRILV